MWVQIYAFMSLIYEIKSVPLHPHFAQITI